VWWWLVVPKFVSDQMAAPVPEIKVVLTRLYTYESMVRTQCVWYQTTWILRFLFWFTFCDASFPVKYGFYKNYFLFIYPGVSIFTQSLWFWWQIN
jgi:hypothetical protein